ncbi:uncharacterized protein LOC125659203 isoform X2 [Ostrea edulis]|uniref:uncharacterized protein LOC125659203 isoform X2 n=1 Tax=Ostrea edulis TaxID=37623 RepID=UPI0024AF1931|nr:uncharacterized protein LOC125659203 isoform X2 [Ostrea edulis]
MNCVNMGSRTCCYLLIQLLYFVDLEGVLAITCKTYYSSNSSLFYYEYCSVGCCGSERSFKCCSSENTGAIIGGVVGALLFFLVVAAVAFMSWQSSKKKTQLVDVEPQIDEFGYELEAMGDLRTCHPGAEAYSSPISPSHLQEDFHQRIDHTDMASGEHECPPPVYEDHMPPMSPPPSYQERETTSVSEKRY